MFLGGVAMSKYVIDTPDREEFYKQVRERRQREGRKRAIPRILVNILRIEFFVIGLMLAIFLPFIQGKDILWQIGVIAAAYLFGEFVIIRGGVDSKETNERVIAVIAAGMLIVGLYLFFIEGKEWIAVLLGGLGFGVLVGTASHGGGEIDYERLERNKEKLTSPRYSYLPYNIFHD